MSLMLNDFSVLPITCIWGEFEDVFGEISALLKAPGIEWKFLRESLQLNRVYIGAPPKGGAHLPKFALWRPANCSKGCVFLPNLQDGRISLIRWLNRKYNRRCIRVILQRGVRIEESYCGFEYFQESGQRRIVHVIHDEKWQFYQEGEVQPFENPTYYEQPRVSERLTPAIIQEYLKTLGWDLQSEDFWHSDEAAYFGEQLNFPDRSPGKTVNVIVKY